MGASFSRAPVGSTPSCVSKTVSSSIQQFAPEILCARFKMIKYLALCLVVCVCLSEAQRRPSRRRPGRRGRQDEAVAAYDAPAVYEGSASDEVAAYGADDAAGDDPLAALANNIPGVPGEDYPILPRFPSLDFPVKDKLTEDTTLILKPSARCSTSVLLMARVVCPSTASSVPMAPSSTRTTSSVTGGLTLTALKLKVSTLSMMISLPKELKLMLLPVMTWLPMELLPMITPLELKLL